MPQLDIAPPTAQGIAFSPKDQKLSDRYRQGGTILDKGNFEGGSFEDDGNFEEFDDNQNIALDERLDPEVDHISNDDDDDDDDDFGEGEGESEKDEKSVSGGSRSSIKEFQSHMIGQNYDILDCTTPNFSGLTMVGMNAQEHDIERPPRIVMDADHDKDYLRVQGITGKDIELMSVETDEELERLKNKLRFKFPSLMANIALILLHKEEENLACFLTAYYELALEETTILYAIERG